MQKHSLILVLISQLLPLYLQAQETVTGRVTDKTTNEPLPGATIISDSDTVITDRSGEFSLSMAAFPATLSVRFIGYNTFQTSVSQRRLRIELVPSTLALNEVVVTSGTQQNKIRNLAGSVDLISQGMLQRDDPFSITNSINRVPGVYMHSGTFNTNRITIRGVGSRSLYGTNKIKAYYDQIPLTDGSGNSTLEDVDQALIDRIEVVKGPNSSLYGAGLAGVVRLYSFQPESNQTSLESSLTLGSYGTSRWVNRFSHSDENKSINLMYSNMSSDGYRQNSAYDRNQIGITSRFYPDDKSHVSFLAVYTDLKAYIPSSLDEDDFLNNPQAAAGNWASARGYEQYDKGLFGVSYTTELIKNLELSSSVFVNFRDAYEPTPIGGQGILDENTVSIGTRNTIAWQSETFSVIAGTELFRDTYEWSMYQNLYNDTTGGSVTGPVFSINEENRSYSNFFAEASYRPASNMTIVAGLNLNQTYYDLEDKFVSDSLDQSGRYSFDPVWSPRIGLSYAITENTNAFLNISHGFSPPGLNETLYPDGEINTAIRPETGWNIEAGTRGNVGAFNYDLGVYLMKIQHLIVPQRVGENQYIGVNAGLNTHIGLDFYANYPLLITDNYVLNIFNSFSWMHYRFSDFYLEDEFNPEGVDYSGNQLTGVPRISINPGIELLSESGFYGNINGQYIGRIPMNDENSLYSRTYIMIRTRAGYRFHMAGWEVDLNAGINNLTNEHYASMLLINAVGFGGNAPRYYYPGLPRNYYGGATIKYNF